MTLSELTESKVKENFGDRTFSRGLDYYNNDHVLRTVKVGNTLYAEVMGSAFKPYKVSTSIEEPETHTDCTCPVGNMCKHGAALILKWLHEPSSFVDFDEILQSLEKMTKNELIEIIKSTIQQNPFLINKFSINEGDEHEINIEAISNKIRWIVCGELDYYNIWEAIRSLEEIKNTAENLKEKGSYKSAAEVYLALVEGGVSAYGEGADDSDGGLGEFVISCVEGFNECLENIDDISFKNKHLSKILDVVEEDGYGLEAQSMLFGIVSKDNIHTIESYFLGKLDHKRQKSNSFSYNFNKQEYLEILCDLYGHIGLPEERLRIARYELVNKEDYARVGNVLVNDNRLEDALDVIKTGLGIPGDKCHELNNLYSSLSLVLINRKKPELVDFYTALNVFFDIIGGRFDMQAYKHAKKVFQGIGKLDDFKSAMLETLENRDSVALVFLHDGDLRKAINIVFNDAKVSSDVIIKVAKAAKDEGMVKESAQLTELALGHGWIKPDTILHELIKTMVNFYDIDVLRDLCNRISNRERPSVALLLIPYLIEKEPELSALLVRKFIEHIPVEMAVEVADAVAIRNPEEGVALCKMRITDDILSSHVHYDKVIYLFKVMRNICASGGIEKAWDESLRKFAAENKGKKKLIKGLNEEFNLVL